MKARLVEFGVVEIEGLSYDHDVVIDAGVVRKRRKAPSKHLRSRYGHTPLSADEDIPWRGQRLIIGTGAQGALPVMPEVAKEAKRRGIQLETLPTAQACELLAGLAPADVHAILHVTC